MDFHIDAQVSSKCWNLYDSYGEICVHCGCCSKDPLTRYNARIEVLLRWIEQCETFDGWIADSSLRAIQETNIARDLKAYRRKLRYYKKKLDEEERKTQAAPVSTEMGMDE